jgi:hypothetical protein
MLLDTSAITSDIVAALKRGRDSSLLAAMDARTCVGFMPVQIAAEVPRVLADRHRESGGRAFNLDRALTLWRDRYLPVVRLVDVIGLPHGPAAQAVAARDASDTPTGQLAELLSEVLVVASDKDLKVLQPAATDWQRHRADLGTMHTADAQMMGAGFVVYLGGASAVAVARAAARYPLPALLLAGAALAFTAANPGRVRMPAWAPELLKALGAHLGSQLDARNAAQDRWNEACFVSQTDGLLFLTARVLADSPGPMTRTQLTQCIRELDPGAPGHRDLMAQLSQILTAYPAFCPVDTPRWQLGHDGIDVVGV